MLALRRSLALNIGHGTILDGKSKVDGSLQISISKHSSPTKQISQSQILDVASCPFTADGL